MSTDYLPEFLNQPTITEAHIIFGTITDNHVIQNPNAKIVTYSFESAGDFFIFLTGRGVTGRVIVNENDRRRVSEESTFEYFTGMND